MWHTVFIKNDDFILYESEKAVKIKIPLKGAHYIWLPKKLVKFEKFRHEYMTKLLIPDDFKLKGDNFQDFKNYSKTRIFRKVGNKKSVVKMSSNKF